MMFQEGIGDTIVVYMIMKKLTRPWKEWPAYKLGLIDEDGKKLKKAVSKEERDAWTMLDRFIYRLKFTMQKFVGKSRLASTLTTAYLLKDSYIHVMEISNVLVENSLIENFTKVQEYDLFKLTQGIPIDDNVVCVTNQDMIERMIYKYVKRVETFLEESNQMDDLEKIIGGMA